MTSWKNRIEALGCVVVIPTYNNEKTVVKVIEDVLGYTDQVIVVNDGSTDSTLELLSSRKDIELVSYPQNAGKGFALKKGLRRAAEMGFRYAITIDSDGQHFADDIPVFIERIEIVPDSLLIGARNLTADNMPGKNTFANKFSNFWFKVETGITMADTQSGFRLYPLEKLKNMRYITRRYEFELEVIVRGVWRGINVENVPVKVYYPDASERVSHFRPFKDFTRISILNTVLVTIALLYYYPLKFIKSLTWSNVKQFIRHHITHSNDSNIRIALSVMLGIFFGIVPIWGYQMIAAGVSAHFLKLNKVIAVVVSNISIPPMIPLILYGSIYTGGIVLQRESTLSFSNISIEAIAGSMYQYVIGSIVLAIISGLVVGLVTLFFLQLSRKVGRQQL